MAKHRQNNAVNIANLTKDLAWSPENCRDMEALGKLRFFDRPASKEELIRYLDGADYAVLAPLPGSVISADVFKKTPRLKGIAIVTTACHWIDIPAARKHQIEVRHATHYSAVSVAELAVGLTVMLARGLDHAVNDARQGRRWVNETPGCELRGKVMGVIGLGTIGTCVAGLSQGLGLKCIAYNRTPRDTPYPLVQPAELLKKADIIVVCLALNEQTRGFLGRKALKIVKRQALLVNIAPEGLIDQEAVYNMLLEGRLGGYAFETDERRTYPVQKRLMCLKNVMATPHIGWYTREAGERLKYMTIENLREMIQGQTPG